MTVNRTIWIKSAFKGKSDNWLVFSVYVSHLDVNKKYRIEFCGTELVSSLPLTDEQVDGLKRKMVQDFGYAPYNINKVREIIGEGRSYLI